MPGPALLAGLALVAGLVGGCGGGGSSDASGTSEQGFCAAYSDFAAALAGNDGTDTTSSVATAKKAVATLAATGTPDSTPEAAREGFELFTRTIEDLDDDVTEDQLTQIGNAMSASDNDKLTAFQAYAQETCASPTKGSP